MPSIQSSANSFKQRSKVSLRATRKERPRKCVAQVILRLFNFETEDDCSVFSTQE